MEGAVIGYVPYVQPAKSSSIPECYQKNSFIRLPSSENVSNGTNSVEENKMLNTASSDINHEQDSPVELLSNLNEDRKQRLSLKGRSNAMSGKSELSEKKCSSDEIGLGRLVIDEKYSNPDSPIELSSVQNDEKRQRVSSKRSSSSMLELKPEQASQSKKIIEIVDGSNTSLVDELGNDDPSLDKLDKICTEISVLGLSSADASTANASASTITIDMDNNNLSPELSPVSTEASETKKRYLFEFRPNISEIIVKNKSGEKSFKCFVCGGIYQQKFSLKRHYLRNHIDFRYISENDISNCNIPVPNYIKQLHSNLDYKKSSNGRKKFKKSNSDQFLDNNKLCLMPGLYRCHDCPNITCDTEKELKDHYNMHPESIKKKFHCEVCDASFFKKQILSRHLASHGKKKVRFECKKCNIDFPSQVELLRHANSHSSGKMCKYCGKILSTSANRKRHEALHLGLKPYNCTHCGSCFAQSKDLDRHLRKQHSEFCRECPVCNKLFSTSVNLELHIRDKHNESPAKKQEASNNFGSADKENNSRFPASAPTIPSAKTKSCAVCKRTFHTVYAMLKHKRQAHPYHSRKKKRVKQKVGRSKEVSSNLEFRKSYTKPRKTYGGPPESPAKRGRPIQKTTRDSEKYVRRNGRPGPRSISKREEELFKEFYDNVAYQINKNILHHIDGRATQLSLKEYNFNDSPYSSEFFEGQGRLPWSHYNFPQWYDVDNALKTKGQEIKRLENLSSQDEFLYDATGLAPSNRAANADSQGSSDTNVQVTNAWERNEQMSFEERKKLIGREVITVILCCVCKETFNSHGDYEQHIINNHPNVDCDFTAFEGNKEKPPEVPREMRETHLSPVGYRFSCDVPPSHSVGSMKCTKCKSEFITRAELHSHLTICGNLRSYTSSRAWKYNAHRRIKNTMKNRMSAAEQQATLDANDYTTPEKHELKPNSPANSMGKASKSSEKLQFYKSGRLQTTSLTVDMNYFNTKPTKPAKSASKRGRKSYALVSSMYRNATMQPSTSRECSDCGVVFPSLAALNQHLKSHYSEQPTEKTGEIRKVVRYRTCDNETGDALKSALIPLDHRMKNTSEQLKLHAKMPANKITSHRSALPSIPPPSSPTDAVLKDSSPSTACKAGNNKGLLNIQPVDTPIDLSTNSYDKNKASVNQNNVCNMSALQIAIEAVLKFSEDKESEQKTKFSEDKESEQKTRNVHISRLQETVENIFLPIVSPVSKPTMVKKVGRPRKLKKDSPCTPHNLRETSNSGLLGSGALSKSKPASKLEEAVERLKSKVSSQEKRRQNLALAGVSVPETCNAVPQNEPQLEISNQKESAQSNQVIDKDMPESKTANISETLESTSANLTPNDNNSNKSSLSPVNDTCSLTTDEIALTGKSENHVASATSEKTSSGDVLGENIAPLEKQQLQKITFEEERDIQGLPALPNSEFPLPERSEKVNQSSHGRSSPTFDSILKVINQKLHSEEEESSQHDDTAITWLEDEKFEIPPSRSNLNIMVNSSANLELAPVESNSAVSSDINISNGDVNLRSSILPENSEAEKISTLASDCSNSNNKIDENNSLPSGTPKNITSTAGSGGIQISPKEQTRVHEEMQKSPEATVSSPVVSKQEIVAAKSPEKSSSPSTTLKEKTSAETRPPARRGPGRPRKRLLENVEAVIHSKRIKESTTLPGSNAPVRVSPIEKNIVPDDTSLNGGDVSTETISSVHNSNKESDLPQSISKRSSETPSASCSESEAQPSSLSNPDDLDNLNQMELPAVSLRTFRTKAKQTQGDNIAKSNFSLKNNITTEFGKSLASKMKEKMRLSFEQDSSKTVARTDEPVASVSSSSCDANTQPKEKLKAVKKECDTAEPTKIHSCPYCMLEFAYLTNFRRHLKACLARTESKEADSAPGNSATNLQHLPKKDEVDYSMLNLYRHQSRQTQMLKEVEKNLGSDTPIKKYECTVCHRIYLNLFTFLQHKIKQHNLAAQSSSEANASSDSTSCPTEMNDISNTFANESTSDSTQQENGIESVHYESLIDNFISEQSNESAVDDPPVSDLKETNSQVDESLNKTQCGTLELKDSKSLDEVTEENKPADLPEDSNDSESVKDEKIPAKRKRGRPFGWRKHVNVAEENKNKSEPEKEAHSSNKNKELIIKRAGRPNSTSKEAIISPKLKAKTKKVILTKVEKTAARTKLVASDENRSLDTNPLNDTPKMKPEKSDAHPPQSSSTAVKEVLKDLPKLKDDSGLAGDEFVDFKMDKHSKSSAKTKNSPVEVETKKQGMKRGRGRPPISPPTPDPDMPPLKRRPGRPPKNLQAAAGPSQPVKHIANSLPMRSGRKQVPIVIDSSDSDCEVVKPDIPVRKKVKRVCSFCKKEFLSSLALHRHIQIVHSRRVQPVSTVNKTGLPVKVTKKATPKSPPVIDTSEGDSDVPAKRTDDAAMKKTPNFKNCPICKSKFSSISLLRSHLQTYHSRKTEATAVKLKVPAEASDSDSNRPVVIKKKNIVSPNRNSLTRQCRKSPPLLQKRVKKQPPEQAKKQKV